MYKKLKIKNKNVKIYYENSSNTAEISAIIYNSYTSNTEELWEELIKQNCKNFILIAISNINWEEEMTPYYMEKLFKGENDYTGKADEYLKDLTNEIIPKIKEELEQLNIRPKGWSIAGYSLSGLFAIYSMYKTDIFSKYVSCSGSFWYKDFDKFVFENKPIIKPEQIYLSLGDKEKISRNQVLSTVENKTLNIYDFYKNNGINITFEMNEGNHFKDENLRVAKGIKAIL